MSDSLEFTGERFTPECEREIWYEHFHRYALVTRWCEGQRTLDAACGEGYGSALLAGFASSVEAVDISEQAIKHARKRYANLRNVGFHQANCTTLPFADNEFDRVVSFETLEHLAEHDELLTEFRRVLKPGGFLILSSPDKAVYTDQQQNDNEFHVKELYRDELETLIHRHFPACHLLGQKLMFHSAIWSMDGIGQVSLDQLSENGLSTPASITQAPMYYIALCAASADCLPVVDGQLWLFDDVDESVYQHYYSEIRRHIAAGGIIARLQEEIEALKAQVPPHAPPPLVAPIPRPASWWRRMLNKT